MTPFAELSQFPLDPASIRLLPQSYALKNRVVILGRVDPASDDAILLGMASPDDMGVIQGLQLRLGRPIEGVPLSGYEVEKALAFAWGGALVERREEGRRIPLHRPPAGPDASASELLDDMLALAVRAGASDVHLEVYDDDVDVRLRIDGVLRQIPTQISPRTVTEVTSRIKVLANLDIAERREPQDGRFRCLLEPRDGSAAQPVDFRVNLLPGPFGEDAVLRVVRGGQSVYRLDGMGMEPDQLATLRVLLHNPEGLLLVCGPTGSGKTSTLYAGLEELRDGSRKILTAEDPIELTLPKVNQKQVSASMRLPELSRAFLRQDPDVLLVGEVRDEETAEAVARAAATGRLVLGTLHTPDALGAIPRLRGLGLADDEIANALLGVLSQRLVRRICQHCREEVSIPLATLERFSGRLAGLRAWKGRGCNACGGSGYQGRVGIFELLVADEALRDRVADGMSTTDLRAFLRGRGFRSLVEAGLTKVSTGQTTVEELLRVIPHRMLQSGRA